MNRHCPKCRTQYRRDWVAKILVIHSVGDSFRSFEFWTFGFVWDFGFRIWDFAFGSAPEWREAVSVVRLRSVWDRRGSQDHEGAAKTVAYLARYANRVAISNSRLIGIEGEEVLFRHKDNRNGGRWATKAIPGVEFIGRFLQHRLPKGLRHIRNFGFLGPRVRTEKLNEIRVLLRVPQQQSAPPPESAAENWGQDPDVLEELREAAREADQPAPRRCQDCGGQFVLVAETRRPSVAELLAMPPSMELPAKIVWMPPLMEPRAKIGEVQRYLPRFACL